MLTIFLRNKMFFGLMILVFILLGTNINQPFWGHHEWNGVFYSNIARNYLRYGFIKTKFGEVINYGVVNSENFHFHTQHPVLFPILLAIFFKIFGIGEWQARLLPIIFSLASLYIFNLILKKIYNFSLTYLPVILGIITPLFLYYARMPVYEPIIGFFILLTVYFYWLWRNNPQKLTFIIVCLSLLICQMIEWPGYYLGLTLFLHLFLFPVKTKSRLRGLWWLILSLASFSLVVIHQYLLTGEVRGALFNIFMKRMGEGTSQPFTLWQFIRLEIARARSFLTTPLLALAFYWFIVYLIKIIRQQKISPQEHFSIFFLFFGVLHIIIFPNVAWYHDYMWYYFFFPLLLAVSIALKNIFSKAKQFKFLVFLVILLLVFLEKRKFFIDLKKLNPHFKCVKWGKEIKTGLKPSVIELDSEEDAKICPPFTNYYADQEVEFKLKK